MPREYKQSISIEKSNGKVEFLADISSFANSSGGDLIYGIKSDKSTGLPVDLVGLNVKNMDREISRLETIIRNGIDPRLPQINSQPITLKNTKQVLIIRVAKSWIMPHRVIKSGHDKFYARSSNGKYPLDVSELRTAFTLSESINEKIRRFKEDRISKIITNETPIPLYTTPKIILHLIPLISFSPSKRYQLDLIHSDKLQHDAMGISLSNRRYNFDGLLIYDFYSKEKSSCGYIQIFNNGIIEVVNAYILAEREKGKLFIPCITFERNLISGLTDYLKMLNLLNVELPISLFITLTAMKGYSMTTKFTSPIHEPHTIEKDILPLPGEIIEIDDISSQEILQPCFDTVWQSCGYAKSENYNEEGEWAPNY